MLRASSATSRATGRTCTSLADPAALDAELARIRGDYNTVRLHAAIGYVTPDDEHHGRGPAIRRARAAGMARARAERIRRIGDAADDGRSPTTTNRAHAPPAALG